VTEFGTAQGHGQVDNAVHNGCFPALEVVGGRCDPPSGRVWILGGNLAPVNVSFTGSGTHRLHQRLAAEDEQKGGQEGEPDRPSAQHKIHRFQWWRQFCHAECSQDITLDTAHDRIAGQVVFVAAERVFQFIGNRIQAEKCVADNRG
jgi:hypothetical protein